MRYLILEYMQLDESFVKRQEKFTNMSMEELIALRKKIEGDPKSKNPKGGFNIYTKAAKKKLDDIAWAITYKLQEKKRK